MLLKYSFHIFTNMLRQQLFLTLCLLALSFYAFLVLFRVSPMHNCLVTTASTPSPGDLCLLSNNKFINLYAYITNQVTTLLYMLVHTYNKAPWHNKNVSDLQLWKSKDKPIRDLTELRLQVLPGAARCCQVLVGFTPKGTWEDLSLSPSHR